MNQRMFGLFLLGLVGFVSAVKVPVTVYYESLCPDSAKFITEQVYPAMQGPLKDYVDITWVPFGKSEFKTLGSEVTFTCHHGPNECYGNKVHACAVEHIQASSYVDNTRESLTLDFINCMMKFGKNFPDNVYPGVRCANDSSVKQWENIQQCANSTEGSQQLKKHGEATLHFQNPLVSVPTVVFEQLYDSNENQRAMTDFLGTVCKHIKQPSLPPVCAHHNGAAAATVSLFSSLALPLCGALLYAVISKML